mmetsp:Transcript_13374/g.19480  ORF Transcript_13374/g.19480 Transcript_13374/m.19480 type:complete len:201 (-) Transcript_13374:583-1185(-)
MLTPDCKLQIICLWFLFPPPHIKDSCIYHLSDCLVGGPIEGPIETVPDDSSFAASFTGMLSAFGGPMAGPTAGPIAGPIAVRFNFLDELLSTPSLTASSDIDSFDSAICDVRGPMAGPIAGPMAVAVTLRFFLLSSSFFITPNSRHLISYCLSCPSKAGIGQTSSLCLRHNANALSYVMPTFLMRKNKTQVADRDTPALQ